MVIDLNGHVLIEIVEFVWGFEKYMVYIILFQTPVRIVLLFISYWVKRMTRIKFCAAKLDMTKQTLDDLTHYLREVCAWRIKQNDPMIAGERLVVEIREYAFVHQKNCANQMVPDQWIFCGICRETKECFVI